MWKKTPRKIKRKRKYKQSQFPGVFVEIGIEEEKNVIFGAAGIQFSDENGDQCTINKK
jgi:hypothetical protein